VLAKVNEALAANVFVDFAAFVDATADRMTAMVTAAGQTGETRGRWCSLIFIYQSERVDWQVLNGSSNMNRCCPLSKK
jgi:hypothetical protein